MPVWIALPCCVPRRRANAVATFGGHMASLSPRSTPVRRAELACLAAGAAVRTRDEQRADCAFRPKVAAAVSCASPPGHRGGGNGGATAMRLTSLPSQWVALTSFT
jgi:hypothetical protein